MTSDQCAMCKHLLPGFKCEAFPEGIPYEIATGKHDHRKPFPGDNGILFRKRPLPKAAQSG